MARLIKIGNQVLPLRLQSVSVENGEIIPRKIDFPMTYRAPISFTFNYLNTIFVVQFLEIGNAARVKVTGNITKLPPIGRKTDRNRVLALMDIITDDVKNSLRVTADEHINFYAESDLEAPISAEKLMVTLTKSLAWHKNLFQLVQEQSELETA